VALAPTANNAIQAQSNLRYRGRLVRRETVVFISMTK